MMCSLFSDFYIFFFNNTATTEIYTDLHTLSLHDALPIFVDILDIHGEAFEAVGQLARDRLAVEAAHLLEISELGDFHPVAPDLPAQPPCAQCRRFPEIRRAHV